MPKYPYVEEGTLISGSRHITGERDVFGNEEGHSIKYKTLSWQLVAVLMIAEIVSNGMLSLPSSGGVVGVSPSLQTFAIQIPNNLMIACSKRYPRRGMLRRLLGDKGSDTLNSSWVSLAPSRLTCLCNCEYSLLLSRPWCLTAPPPISFLSGSFFCRTISHSFIQA